MKHKVVITKSESTINSYLDDGWLVLSITRQFLAMTSSYYSKEEGGFCFVLQKEE